MQGSGRRGDIRRFHISAKIAGASVQLNAANASADQSDDHIGTGRGKVDPVRAMRNEHKKIQYYTLGNIHRLPQFQQLPSDEQFALRVVGRVLPFRVNNYVTDRLIDWSSVPDDPMFRLTFMHRDMLPAESFERMAEAVRSERPEAEIRRIAADVRRELNPHPAGQMTENVPLLDGIRVPGLQHKYRETCLIFPRQGQTCHAYCTFCFRWPQFVGMKDLKFATDSNRTYLEYLRRHREVTDVLITGGDPMVMNARNLASYVRPLLGNRFDHIQSIRIGTKSVAYWPYRFVTDPDADEVLRLFEEVVASGKHLALMAHYSHLKELVTPVAQEAIRRIRSTGAEIRTQSPVLRNINDDSDVWARMWQIQVRLGCVPYYMFVERHTGASRHFELPLVRTWEIFRNAYQRVSGLARTVRGPSMSAHPGKVLIDGVAQIAAGRVFVLQFLQARRPEFVRRPFFARFDPSATWLTDLRPLAGKERFFFEVESRLEREGAWPRRAVSHSEGRAEVLPGVQLAPPFDDGGHVAS